MEELQQAFRAAQEPLLQKPKAILARTVKGYGIKAMENVTKFHFRVPTKEEMAKGVRYE